MNLRNSDFGIDKEMYKEICHKIQSGELKEPDLLHRAAVESNPAIANYLVNSIEKGMSYERLSGLNYIPINKNDFYAYRRKCIAIYYQMIKEGI